MTVDRASGRLTREGRVVEWQGEAVVRFVAGGCVNPAEGTDGACNGCPAAARVRQIPLAWLCLPGTPAPGERLTLEVARGGLARVAGVLFVLPLAALVAGAWLGALVGGSGVDREAASGLAGMTALAVTWAFVARRGAALTEMLKLTARRGASAACGAEPRVNS